MLFHFNCDISFLMETRLRLAWVCYRLRWGNAGETLVVAVIKGPPAGFGYRDAALVHNQIHYTHWFRSTAKTVDRIVFSANRNGGCPVPVLEFQLSGNVSNRQVAVDPP
jgi:hypothetical protein